jgi:hypothetical protein
MLIESVRTRLISLFLAFSLFLALAPANAAGFGPNLTQPDSNLVMPMVAKDNYTTFFIISNLGPSEGSPTDPEPVEIQWDFYDASGELLESVSRYVLGEGGTDIVDPSSVRSKAEDGTLGPPISLLGRNGFVVVSDWDDEPRLIGNFTVANTQTSAAWGAAAVGLGVHGKLQSGDEAVGTTFKIDDLEDNLLVVIGINDEGFGPESLTDGFAPEEDEEILKLEIRLQNNQIFNPSADQVVKNLAASAFFSTLEELFPRANPELSGTLAIRPTDRSTKLLAFYGQAVGPFGAGQTFRMVPQE